MNCTRWPLSSLQVCQISTELKKITGRLSNKPFLVWLSSFSPHLEYVATLPCNLCFLTLTFHTVVRQHMQGLVRPLITTLLQIYCRILHWKNLRDFTELWPLVWCAVFIGLPCTTLIRSHMLPVKRKIGTLLRWLELPEIFFGTYRLPYWIWRSGYYPRRVCLRVLIAA